MAHGHRQQLYSYLLGELHYFLGVKIVQDKKNGAVWVAQPAYKENILNKFGIWRMQNQSAHLSTQAEAEYMTLASAAQEAIWLRRFVSDLKNEPTTPTLINFMKATRLPSA